MKADIPESGAKPLSNPRHEIFAQARFAGDTAADAYRKAYPKFKGKDITLWPAASRLDADCKVSARLAYLQAKAASAKVLTKQRALEILTEQAEATLADFVTCSADGVWFHDYGSDKQRHRAVKKIKTRTEITSHGRGENKTEDQAILTEVELEPKVAAIERIAKMLGWDAPARNEHTGPDGKPLALTPTKIIIEHVPARKANA